MEQADPGLARSNGTRRALLVLFFLSGACGLVYEVVWMRELTLVFGATAFATSTILAAFFTGLALGSLSFGRIADRRSDPLKIYALLEAGIGVFAFVMPFLLAGLSDVYVDIARRWSIGYYAINAVRFSLSFLVLLIPATLMGGTLPVMVKFFAREEGRLGRDIGRLYAVNTFGAVVGTFLAGFLLILLLGVHETAWAAGAVNLLVAAAVWGLALRDARRPSLPPATATPDADDGPAEGATSVSDRVARLALWTAGVSGFCALALEVLWTRSLVFFLDNSTHAFSTILTAFLIGIALGSAVVARWIDRGGRLLTGLGVLQVMVGVSAVLAIPVLNHTSPVLQRMTDVTPDALLYWKWTGMRFLTSLSVMLVPTVLMGMAFPLAARIHARRVDSVGTALGNVYSFNTFAGVIGSVAAGFLLIPLLGMRVSILLVAAISVALGAVLVLADPVATRSGRTKTLGALGVVTAAVAALYLSIGKEPLTSYIERMDADIVLAYDEDIGATVKVFADTLGQRYVSIDGFPVAGTSLGLLDAQKSLSALPMLLTSVDSPRVNIVGFGAGGTSWGILQYGVEKIDCVELVPAVLDAAVWFPDVNHGVIDEPRYNVIRGDGRNYALVSDETYDVISIDATSPKMAGNGSLYALEFYELLDQRLSDRGLVAQWLPFHLLSDAEMRMTARTFQAVFPHTTLWFSPIRHHAVLIGTKQPLRIDHERLRRRLDMEGVRAELRPMNVTSAIDVLGWFAMGEDALRAYTEGARMNTDDHPYLEFAPAMAYFVSRSYLVRNLLNIRQSRESPLPLLVGTGATEEERAAVADDVLRRFEATQYSITGDAYYFAGETERALREYDRALATDPRDKNWLHPAWANVTRGPR
jgi:spermidine synthase